MDALPLGVLFHVRGRHGHCPGQPSVPSVPAGLGAAAQSHHPDLCGLYVWRAGQPAVSGAADRPLWLSGCAAPGAGADDAGHHQLGPGLECSQLCHLPLRDWRVFGADYHLGLSRHDPAQQQGRSAARRRHHQPDDCLWLWSGAGAGRPDGAVAAHASENGIHALHRAQLSGHLRPVPGAHSCASQRRTSRRRAVSA